MVHNLIDTWNIRVETENGEDFAGVGKELVDPVKLAAEYSLEDPVRFYLKEIGQIPLLSSEEEQKLAKRTATGNQNPKRNV